MMLRQTRVKVWSFTMAISAVEKGGSKHQARKATAAPHMGR